MTDEWADFYNNAYTENWVGAFHRMAAWWNGAPLSRPIVRVRHPVQNQSPAPENTDWQKYHSDPQMLIERFEQMFVGTRYYGEALPCINASEGHSIASFFGCPLTFDSNTVWTTPCLRDIHQELDATAWKSDTRWLDLKRKLKFFLDRSGGRYGVGYYLGGVMQGISLMRGESAFLMDLVDDSDAVQLLRDRLLEQWFFMAEQLECLLPTTCGYWMPFSMWAPGRCVFCECDISCTFSPRLFRRFVVPEVRAMAQWARYSFYHLDGPGADKHLDALLEIDELDCIQWVRGAAGGSVIDWVPLLQRIGRGGKRLYLECPLDELEAVLAKLDPRSLLVDVENCRTPQEARQALRIVGQCSPGTR